MQKNSSTLSLTQFVWGVLVTLIICTSSVIGAYMSLREGDIERNSRIETLEKRMDKSESNQAKTDERYLEILQKLTDIQVKLEGKKDRE
jgi:hypothetical protein